MNKFRMNDKLTRTEQDWRLSIEIKLMDRFV